MLKESNFIWLCIVVLAVSYISAGIASVLHAVRIADLDARIEALEDRASGLAAQHKGTIAEDVWPVTLFQDLSDASVDGDIAYCPDCGIGEPCEQGGSGALAVRVNGQWVCPMMLDIGHHSVIGVGE